MLNTPLRLAAAFLFVGMIWGALPSAASAQANFDCRRPRSEAVATICSDPEMSALDRQIDEAYRVAIETAEEPDRVRDNHTGWANGIAACGADRPCLTKALEQHLASLEYATRQGLAFSAEAVADRPDKPGKPSALPGVAAPIVDVASLTDEQEAAAPLDTETADYLEAEQPASAEESGDVISSQSGTSRAPAQRNDTTTGLIGGGLLLGLVVAVLGGLLGTKALAEHSAERYGWPMILNWWNVLHVAAVFSFYIGWMFAGPLAGCIVAFGIWLIVTIVNIRKTSLGFGLVISVVQPLVVWILYAVIALSRHKPTKYDYRT